jgi:hypothetical protein
MNPETNRFEPLSTEAEAAARKLREEFGTAVSEDPVERLTKGARALEKEAKRLDEAGASGVLLRPDGSSVPKHWSVFTVGEDVIIKDYTFRVAYIGETSILFEPVGLPVIDGSG